MCDYANECANYTTGNFGGCNDCSRRNDLDDWFDPIDKDEEDE